MPRLRLPFSLALLSIAWLAAGCGSDRDDNPVAPPPPTRELNSALLAQNQTYQHQFANAGSYPYHCTPHPSMRDTIVVDASSSTTSATVNIQAMSFTPKKTTIAPGGTVTWTNLDAQGHTVTSD